MSDWSFQQVVRVLDEQGTDPDTFVKSQGRFTIRLTSHSAFNKVCAGFGARQDGGRRTNANSMADHRTNDAESKNVVIEHLCWPHLDCWNEETPPAGATAGGYENN